MIHSFPPLINERSSVLLLGTMPGVQSLEKREYYGNAYNQFWKIMFCLLDKELTVLTPYGEKKALLLENRIALWDVLAFCDREGSADNNITGEVPNDFDSLFTDYPNVKHIFFTSRNAEKYYDRLVGRKPHLTYHTLPSPSTAYAQKSLIRKIAEWKVVTDVLKLL